MEPGPLSHPAYSGVLSNLDRVAEHFEQMDDDEPEAVSGPLRHSEAPADFNHAVVVVPRLCREFARRHWITSCTGDVAMRLGDMIYAAPIGIPRQLVSKEHLFMFDAQMGHLKAIPDPVFNLKKSPLSTIVNKFLSGSQDKLVLVHLQTTNLALASSLSDSQEFKCGALGLNRGLGAMLGDRSLEESMDIIVPLIEDVKGSELLEALQREKKNRSGQGAVMVRNGGLWVWASTWQECLAMVETYVGACEITVEMFKLDSVNGNKEISMRGGGNLSREEYPQRVNRLIKSIRSASSSTNLESEARKKSGEVEKSSQPRNDSFKKPANVIAGKKRPVLLGTYPSNAYSNFAKEVVVPKGRGWKRSKPIRAPLASFGQRPLREPQPSPPRPTAPQYRPRQPLNKQVRPQTSIRVPSPPRISSQVPESSFVPNMPTQQARPQTMPPSNFQSRDTDTRQRGPHGSSQPSTTTSVQQEKRSDHHIDYEEERLLFFSGSQELNEQQSPVEVSCEDRAPPSSSELERDRHFVQIGDSMSSPVEQTPSAEYNRSQVMTSSSPFEDIPLPVPSSSGNRSSSRERSSLNEQELLSSGSQSTSSTVRGQEAPMQGGYSSNRSPNEPSNRGPNESNNSNRPDSPPAVVYGQTYGTSGSSPAPNSAQNLSPCEVNNEEVIYIRSNSGTPTPRASYQDPKLAGTSMEAVEVSRESPQITRTIYNDNSSSRFLGEANEAPFPNSPNLQTTSDRRPQPWSTVDRQEMCVMDRVSPIPTRRYETEQRFDDETEQRFDDEVNRQSFTAQGDSFGSYEEYPLNPMFSSSSNSLVTNPILHRDETPTPAQLMEMAIERERVKMALEKNC